MAMYSWPMMPPPKVVEAAIGERRITNFTPVGISVCEPLDVAAAVAGAPADDKEAQQAALARAAFEAASKEYLVLQRAIKDKAFRAASPQFSQPWAK